MDLSGTDLVVLSACKTGLGDISTEGFLGVEHAFKRAGVNSILMTLWKVDDLATRLIMEEFYKNYLSGKSKIESLRNAQKFVKNYTIDGEKPYINGKYWAAFMLVDALD